jgi:hypothetical protein
MLEERGRFVNPLRSGGAESAPRSASCRWQGQGPSNPDTSCQLELIHQATPARGLHSSSLPRRRRAPGRDSERDAAKCQHERLVDDLVRLRAAGQRHDGIDVRACQFRQLALDSRAFRGGEIRALQRLMHARVERAHQDDAEHRDGDEAGHA